MRSEAAQQLQPEQYHNYLLVLARMTLRASGPLQRKVNASDVVQEALLQAHKALPQFKGSSDAELAAWLRTILANKLADAARHFGRKKRDAALEESWRETINESARRLSKRAADQTSPSQYVLRHERAMHLADALQALPEEQRKAVELHHLEDYSVAEIARKMDRTKASVAGLIRRGLKSLRARLRHLE